MISVKDLRELTKELTILYAEDELWLRENMAETLKRLFHHTLIAENGEEAVEYFKNNRVDLILTDINMPKMNGVDFIKAVHELSDPPPPIIVLTAHTEAELLMELIDLNIDKFINKPVDKQKLITT
ncbi:MAG: response regulator, partial [Sulfuricurvum sp.]|uniref:response regulator n=1 Tax=Sulfuricurvum sp. TaxID=2025608 RepID=UPI0025D41B83